MFKYFGFRNTTGFLTKTVAKKIEGMVEQLNITRPEIEDHCQRAENEAIKKEFEALLLSYVYVFMDRTSSEVGYGDLSAEEYFDTEKLNGNLTKIFNAVAGSSLPSMIPIQDISKSFKKIDTYGLKQFFGPSAVAKYEGGAKKRYKDLWKVFLDGDETILLQCGPEMNCSSQSSIENFYVAVTPHSKEWARSHTRKEGFNKIFTSFIIYDYKAFSLFVKN